MAREIPLTQGKVALVDNEDFEQVSKLRWYAHKSNDGLRHYAITRSGGGNDAKIGMHRFILNAPKGLDVDHSNGDGLDNRRENLRVTTRGQNISNQRLRRNSTSGYKGVSFDKRRGKWVAQIKRDGRNIHLGYFEHVEDAARAYDHGAVEIHGEFARTNADLGFV